MKKPRLGIESRYQSDNEKIND